MVILIIDNSKEIYFGILSKLLKDEKSKKYTANNNTIFTL